MIPLVATFHTKYREDFRRVLNNELLEEFLMLFIGILRWGKTSRFKMLQWSLRRAVS
jgi:hypothetical protein